MKQINYFKTKADDPEEPTYPISQFLAKALVQIFDLAGKKFHLIGTGVVFSQNRGFYLISAAHVFQKAKNPHICWNKKFSPLTEGYIQIRYANQASESTSMTEKPDFAWVPLPDTLFQSDSTDFFPFNESMVARNIYPEAIFIIAGFLISKTKHVLATNMVHPETFVHEMKFRATADSNYFILPKYRSDGSSLPELNGLSGAPIFHISPDPVRILLFGIGTYYVQWKDNPEMKIGFELFENYLPYIGQR